MPPKLSPERRALLAQCVEEGWPIVEMARTHQLSADAVKKYHPEYGGVPKAEAAKLGAAARRVSLSRRRNYAFA